MTSDTFTPAEPALRPTRRPALLWLAVCCVLIALLGYLLPHSTLSSSVLSLLPAQSFGAVPPAFQDGFIQRLDRQLVWMVSPPPGQSESDAVAQRWFDLLQTQPLLHGVKGRLPPEQQTEWGTFFFQYRNGMIDPQTRLRLAGGGAAQQSWILTQLYSAFSGISSAEIKNDPMLLVRGSQLALQQNAGRLQLRNGWLSAQDAAGRRWIMLHGELSVPSYSMQQAHQIVTSLTALEKELQQDYPGAQVMSRGAVFYSNDASQRAQHDISTLGAATVGGVFLLIFLVFRSVRPLVLCLLSVATGALAGIVSTLLIFGELHVMTLAMSISIVGLSADYTIYYLTERMVHGHDSTPWQSLYKVRSALITALATTVLAYLIMMLAPFPALRQLAVFSAAGLVASCVTVLCWHPWLCRGMPVRAVPLLVPLMRWLSLWRTQPWLYAGLPVLLAIFSVAALIHVRVDDDIARLQSAPPDISRQEKAIAALTGQAADQKWFIVYGKDAQQTLERAEQFSAGLERAKTQGWLTDYRLLPLSSLHRQEQDLALIRQAAPKITAQLMAAGIHNASVDDRAMPVTPEIWLASVVSEGWSMLWLTLPDGRSSLLVPASGVADSAALARLAMAYSGVSWIDRKAAFDDMFGLYRARLGWLLVLALVAIAFGFVLRLGWRRGLRCVVPSMLSLGSALGVLTFTGHTLNLFSMLALVLVLGIGINYTLFFSHLRSTPVTSMLAVSVAMCTSLMTLGMLVFSGTQAISSFGIVLCGGIVTAFVLSPMTATPRRKSRSS